MPLPRARRGDDRRQLPRRRSHQHERFGADGHDLDRRHLGHHRRIRPPGLFALYVAGYSAFRIFAELIRVDPAHHVFGLRLNLFVAVTLTVVGLVWFVRTQRQSA